MSEFRPLFIFTADTHLQSGAWARYPRLQGDAYHSFRQIVDFCLDKGLPLVLGGDIFDKARPDPYSVRFFCEQMHRMELRGLSCAYVQGDHDFDARSPWPAVSPWPHSLHKTQEMCGGMAIYGLDWTCSAELPKALESIPSNTHILVTHQSWSELQGIGAVEGQAATIPHAQVLLTGDYHKEIRGTIKKTNSMTQSLMLVSPGSTCMQAIDESPTKYFMVVGQEQGQVVCRRQQLQTRPYFDITIPTEAVLEAVIAEQRLAQLLASVAVAGLPSLLRTPILRVSFDAAIPDVLPRIQQASQDRFHVFPRPIYQTPEETVISQETISTCDNLIAACTELAVSPEQQAMAVRLLQAREPREELERMYHEHLQNAEAVKKGA